jgi:CHAT domain
MPNTTQVNLSDIADEGCVFWSAGNRPTQLLHGLSASAVVLHLKALYLLADKVLGAASYYFESPVTREVTQKLHTLFERGEILYFVDASIENYAEHGALKIEKSPAGLISYRDKKLVQERAKKLDILGYILRRPSFTISDRIAELWIEDITSTDPGTLGSYLHVIYQNESDRAPLTINLIYIAENRGGEDFVWEYLRPKLRRLELPKEFIHAARRRLSQMYAVATSELLGVPIDQSSLGTLSPYISTRSRYDSGLFLDCMEILGVKKNLHDIGQDDLIILKNSSEFIWFKSFYFKLIEVVGYQPSEAKAWLIKYKDAASNYARLGIKIKDFLRTFKSLCNALGKPKQYSRPLEILLYAYNAANHLTIDEFIAKLESLVSGESESTLLESALAIAAIRDYRLEEKEMIKILFATANPKNSVSLRLDEEIRSIDERLRLANYRDRFGIDQCRALRVNDLQGCLLRYDPHIVHFSGHGTKASEIELEDVNGNSQPVPAKALSDLFRTLKGKIRCVVLNACYSEKQARAIAEHIDCVVGMSDAIGDSAAISFASGFYQALGYGKDIKTAFELGCNEINLQNLGDEDLPKLIPRAGIDPSSIVFVP